MTKSLKKYNQINQKKMKKSILIISLMFACGILHAQTKSNISKDAQGNYVQTSKRAHFTDTITGKFFFDQHGQKYPIYKSVNDKLYVWRKSGKTGNYYKFYLRVESLKED